MNSLLLTEVQGLSLRLAADGELRPWLGPALRGLVAGELKKTSCRLPPLLLVRQGPHCKGCPQMQGCPTGETFEAEPSECALVQAGRGDGARPVVLAPYYPAPEIGAAGLEIPFKLSLWGRAAAHQNRLLQTISESGRTAGLGSLRLRFDLSGSPQARQFTLSPGDLPPAADSLPGKIPSLGIGLTAPLFLREPAPRSRGPEKAVKTKRRMLTRPSLRDFFEAAYSTLSGLFAQAGELLEVDLPSLRRAASLVQLEDHCFEPFRQHHFSSRGNQRYPLSGCAGGGMFRNVPLSLLPWLLWGGRLHVGQYRVAGAGSWKIVLP